MLGRAIINGFSYSILEQSLEQITVRDSAFIIPISFSDDTWYRDDDKSKTKLSVQLVPPTIFTGVVDTDILVMKALSINDVISLAKVSSYWKEVSKLEVLWKYLIDRDYPTYQLIGQFGYSVNFRFLYRILYYSRKSVSFGFGGNSVSDLALNVMLEASVLRGDIEAVKTLLLHPWFSVKSVFEHTLSGDVGNVFKWLIEEYHDEMSIEDILDQCVSKQNVCILTLIWRSQLVTKKSISDTITTMYGNGRTFFKPQMAKLAAKLCILPKDIPGLVIDPSWTESRDVEKFIKCGHYPSLDVDHDTDTWDILMKLKRYPTRDVIFQWLYKGEMDKLDLLKVHMYPIHQVLKARYLCLHCTIPQVTLWLRQWGINLKPCSKWDGTRSICFSRNSRRVDYYSSDDFDDHDGLYYSRDSFDSDEEF